MLSRECIPFLSGLLLFWFQAGVLKSYGEERLTNDHFADRIPILTGEVLIYPMAPGGLEPGEPRPNATGVKSFWWTWTAPAEGRIAVKYEGFNGRIITWYIGDSIATLEPVPRAPNSTVASTRAGATYAIQLVAVDADVAPVEMQVYFTPYGELANDHFANAMPLIGPSPNATTPVLNATREPGEPVHRAAGAGKSVWWKWRAPVNSEYRWTNSWGTARGATLALYEGTELDNLRLIAKGQDGFSTWLWGGETYYLAGEVEAEAFGDLYPTFSTRPGPKLSRDYSGNVVRNYSFEGADGSMASLAEWTIEAGGFLGTLGLPSDRGADGGNYFIFHHGRVSQMLQTVPGHTYRVRVAFHPTEFTEEPLVSQVTLGNQVVETALIPWYWQWVEFSATATSATTRFVIAGGAGNVAVDAASVVWMGEPPSIREQPQSASAFVGSSVVFRANVGGSDLLRMQWFHNGVPVPGANTSTLILESVALEQAGAYWLTVSNQAGTATSATVHLTVESATVPEIVLQPFSEHLYAGQAFTLAVLALGTAPLEYEWFKNGTAVAGATNRQFTFTKIVGADAGTYFVVVRNKRGSVSSLPATLEVSAASSGGAYVYFGAYDSGASVYDVDGVTRLLGANYVAQLYVGRSSDQLRPVGAPRPFAPRAGVWSPEVLQLDFIGVGETYFAQVRVWDLRQGGTYEEARAMGGKFGRSAIITELGMEYPDPFSLHDLRSFSLQAGLPSFNSGRIRLLAREPRGVFRWELEGSPGFRYLVEKRSPPARWEPYLILTNQTGRVEFTAQAGDGPNPEFFRSRILD
jgi:hypothetical protein